MPSQQSSEDMETVLSEPSSKDSNLTASKCMQIH